jgi:hypothetical protein
MDIIISSIVLASLEKLYIDRSLLDYADYLYFVMIRYCLTFNHHVVNFLVHCKYNFGIRPRTLESNKFKIDLKLQLQLDRFVSIVMKGIYVYST